MRRTATDGCVRDAMGRGMTRKIVVPPRDHIMSGVTSAKGVKGPHDYMAVESMVFCVLMDKSNEYHFYLTAEPVHPS